MGKVKGWLMELEEGGIKVDRMLGLVYADDDPYKAWDLSPNEKKILDTYMKECVAKGEVDFNLLETEVKDHPTLHNLIRALQGLTKTAYSLAALSLIANDYPEVAKLIAASDTDTDTETETCD